MDLDDARRMGERLMHQHGLTGWRLVFDRAKTRAGVCRFQRREIGLSAPLTRLHDRAAVRDTVLHEIAHALAGAGHGHDAVWRGVARSIGCTASRCLPADAARVRGAWTGECPAGHRVDRHRRPERPASCTVCSPRFDPAHLFEWRHRGRKVRMHPTYEAALAALRSDGERPVALARAGGQVRITASGKYQGQVGRVVKVGRTRYHVQVARGLVTVPFSMAAPTGDQAET